MLQWMDDSIQRIPKKESKKEEREEGRGSRWDGWMGC